MTQRNAVPYQHVVEVAPLKNIESAIRIECELLADFLVSKNRAYGNSVFEPVNTFAKGLSAEQQLYVRIDDKLSRMKNGSEYPGDDTTLDLVGYLVLLRVMKAMGK